MEPKRPLTEPQLAQNLRAYARKATTLEEERPTLVGMINDVLRDEIIPEVEKILPKGYSIDEKESKISLGGGTPSSPHYIAPKFRVDLRLLYDGKTITDDDEWGKLIPSARRKVNPQLQEMAEKYALLRIDLCGEPQRTN